MRTPFILQLAAVITAAGLLSLSSCSLDDDGTVAPAAKSVSGQLSSVSTSYGLTVATVDYDSQGALSASQCRPAKRRWTSATIL